MPGIRALTPELRERMLQGFRLGNYIRTVCANCGISHETYYGWMRRGRKGEQPYKRFAKDVSEALSIAEMRDLATIQKASVEQWQAAAWRLERRYPKRWGRKFEAKATVALPEGTALEFPSRMPPDAIRAVALVMLEHETSTDRRGALEKVLRAVEGL